MTRQHLERHQVWVYLSAVSAGMALGSWSLEFADRLATALPPVLGLLLYTTFTQIPLTHLSDALQDLRFIGAVLVGNFLVVPLVVGLLLPLVPADPAIRLGVLLVLLVPCTDWFITFTHLGGGDSRRALAVTPVNLIAQFGALPLLLWLFLGHTFSEILVVDRFARVFTTLIVMPLAAAWLTERLLDGRTSREAVVGGLGWLPVPLLGVVVFLIAASQVHLVMGALGALGRVAGAFALYLAAAAAVGTAIARLAGLDPATARTLVFSLGTRNSFVVLPFALALPPSWDLAAVVVVLQSLVELWGMVAYLWLVPRWLLPTRR